MRPNPERTPDSHHCTRGVFVEFHGILGCETLLDEGAGAGRRDVPPRCLQAGARRRGEGPHRLRGVALSAIWDGRPKRGADAEEGRVRARGREPAREDRREDAGGERTSASAGTTSNTRQIPPTPPRSLLGFSIRLLVRDPTSRSGFPTSQAVAERTPRAAPSETACGDSRRRRAFRRTFCGGCLRLR